MAAQFLFVSRVMNILLYANYYFNQQKEKKQQQEEGEYVFFCVYIIERNQENIKFIY